jgi:hypothetical protein
MSNPAPVVETTGGKVQETWANHAGVFRGVRMALRPGEESLSSAGKVTPGGGVWDTMAHRETVFAAAELI